MRRKWARNCHVKTQPDQIRLHVASALTSRSLEWLTRYAFLISKTKTLLSDRATIPITDTRCRPTPIRPRNKQSLHSHTCMHDCYDWRGDCIMSGKPKKKKQAFRFDIDAHRSPRLFTFFFLLDGVVSLWTVIAKIFERKKNFSAPRRQKKKKAIDW
jgi:hypothetical protein